MTWHSRVNTNYFYFERYLRFANRFVRLEAEMKLKRNLGKYLAIHNLSQNRLNITKVSSSNVSLPNGGLY